MVPVFLILAGLLASAPVWAGQARQMCLSCHPSHYAERGSCSGCHRGNPASDRKNIAHTGLIAGTYAQYTLADSSFLKGVDNIMEQYSCRRCHISGGKGNRLAVNLDASAARKTPEELKNSIHHPVDSMPDFRLSDAQTALLINAILAGSQAHRTDTVAPVTVHFTGTTKKNADIFSRNCGPCHRLLSERRGVLGSGNIGPNLSGLFSVYYPRTFKDGKAWTVADLTTWLKNPREIQPWARMRPVKLTADELKELHFLLSVTAAP